MSSTNNKQKKKHIYSKDKTPRLEVDEPITNPMQLVTVIKKTENIWSRYIDQVIFNNEPTDLPPDQDLNFVLKRIKDRTTRKSILGYLMKVEGYNPFEDNLPLEKLPENYRIYLEKIQSKIRYNLTNVQHLPMIRRKLTYLDEEYTCCITEFTKENFNKEIFSQGFDFLILQKEGRFLINTNPALKEDRPDLTPIYEKLIQSEGDKWYLHGHNHMIMTKDGIVSSLNFKQIFLFFSQVKEKR